jgi:hypothetical protein
MLLVVEARRNTGHIQPWSHVKGILRQKRMLLRALNAHIEDQRCWTVAQIMK